MEKKYVIIIIAIVVLAGLASFFIKGHSGKKDKGIIVMDRQHFQDCVNNFKIEDVLKKFDSVSDGAKYSAAAYFSCQRMLNGDAEACDNLPDGIFKSECQTSFGSDLMVIMHGIIQKKGFSEGDIDNCITKVVFDKGITTEEKKNRCREALEVAAKGDASACDSFPNDRTKAKCHLLFSTDPGDDYCDKVQDATERQTCLQMAEFFKILNNGKNAQDCAPLYGSEMLDLYSACALKFSNSCSDRLNNLAVRYCTDGAPYEPIFSNNP